jgi:DNA-binding ferritin-like protein
MAKTYRKTPRNITRRKSISSKNSSIKSFQKEITVVFLEMLLMVKLFHWKTHSYATHQATDDLYSKLNEHIDSFIEILLGKTGSRIELMGHKNISLIDLNNSWLSSTYAPK